MPKAKLYRNIRLTKAQANRKKRKKEDGRPKGTLKRFKFEETKLGFFLKHEVPVVYDVIMNMTPSGPYKEPPYLLIKIISCASKDPSLKKPKFSRYLEEYAKSGLYCKRAKKMTTQRESYYRSLRQNKMKIYISKNQQKIQSLILQQKKQK